MRPVLLRLSFLKLALGFAVAGCLGNAAAAVTDDGWPGLPEGWSGVLLVGDAHAYRVRAAGYADHAGLRPVTANTRFNVASANKMLTAVAIAQLHEGGSLNFDDPVSLHLPELPRLFAGRTVRQLLSHTAGLGDIFGRGNHATIAAARTSTDLLPLAVAEKPGPAGSFAYSNAGYIVLGAIIEQVSGLPYDTYLERHIFPAAAMGRSGVAPADDDAEGVVRQGAENASRASGLTRGRGSSAGGAYMTAGDMYRFAQALLDGRLVSKKTLEEMLRPHAVVREATADRPGTDWGLGFGLTGAGDELMFGHSGGAPGIDVFVRIVPATRRVAVVFSNQALEASSRLSRELLQAEPRSGGSGDSAIGTRPGANLHRGGAAKAGTPHAGSEADRGGVPPIPRRCDGPKFLAAVEHCARGASFEVPVIGSLSRRYSGRFKLPGSI